MSHDSGVGGLVVRLDCGWWFACLRSVTSVGLFGNLGLHVVQGWNVDHTVYGPDCIVTVCNARIHIGMMILGMELEACR